MSSCKHRSPGENEEFYQEGLVKLRAGTMEESTGKLIMDLMEIRSENVLVPYARQWIKRFPNAESAPRLTGKWLQNYGSNDAMYLATSYVKNYPDVKALILILRAVAKMQHLPRRLFTAIERRFEAEPNSHVWASLQRNENHNAAIDKVLVQWVERNRSNSSLAVEISHVALFTASKDVLEEILRWTNVNQNKSEDIWMVFSHLFRGRSEVHPLIAEKVAELSRAWLVKHPDSEDCGRVYNDLVAYMLCESDIRNAKDWYQKNRTARSACSALTGILTSMHRRGDTPDPEIVSEAKVKLHEQSPEDRIPVLAGALVTACRDQESIELAKETLLHNQFLTWLHADLLQVAPDAELIEKANKVMSAGLNGAPELIIEMLKIDNSNPIAVKAAERWMRQYSDNKQVETIKALLPSLEKPKRKGVQSKRKA